jgi:PAS domain S-box-containing protein
MESDGTRALDTLVVPWSPWASIRSPWVRNALGFVAFELAFLGAYHFGMVFSPAVSAPFWIPDSVLLCGLLCTRTRWWWLLFAGTLPIRLLVHASPEVPVLFLFACFINDCAKSAGCAWLLRQYMADPIRLNSMRDLGLFWLFAIVLMPLLSAFGGAAARSALGHAYWPSFEQWLLGDALASLVVTPILFYWVLRPPNPATFSTPRIIEAGALAIGLLVTMALAFEADSQQHGFAETPFYAPVPFMVWAAIRFRMFGATAAVAMLSVFAVDAAISGTGSFSGLDPAEASSRLQHFLLLRAAPLYLVAVLIEQWARVSNSLRESEMRFRKMADHAPMMIWMSGPDGNSEYVNPKWLEFSGLTLEQFLGEGWKVIVHPEDAARSMNDYLANIQARRPFEDETRLRRHDGEYRWVFSRGQPRYGDNGEFLGYVGSAMDVTELKQQEAALRRSEARYRDVVESQPGFVCRFLPDTSLTFVNTTWCQFLGRPRLQLLGCSFLELLPPAARTVAQEAVARALQSSAQSAWECEVARADGTRGWQSWVCHVIEAAPEEAREIQAIGYDITDRKRAEESGRQLAHATRFAVVGELTAMVAHEVNQPLCAILSNAEAAEIMLRSDNPPLEELRQILADIRQDDLRADAAIRSIRSLVHRREFQPRAMNLGETIEHVFNLTGGDALHRRVTMRHEIATDLPLVFGDPSHLEQLLVILIVNAMDAMKETPEGSREVVVCAQRADEGSEAKGMVEVAVRDRGHGITDENMPQLFDSLFTTKAEGMGLGLPIARSIVNAHGGRIWPDNAPGGGAVFRFTLREAPAC